jgi:hypothetical protein
MGAESMVSAYPMEKKHPTKNRHMIKKAHFFMIGSFQITNSLKFYFRAWKAQGSQRKKSQRPSVSARNKIASVPLLNTAFLLPNIPEK